MNEFFELLNHTSPGRVLFYGIVFLIALSLVIQGIVAITRSIIKLFSK